MSKEFITIQEAAELLGKSTQTIRRMLKREELDSKKVRTPQGFHYVIARDSLGLKDTPKKPEPVLPDSTVEKPEMQQKEELKSMLINQKEVLTNQAPIEAHRQAVEDSVDKKLLKELMDRQHKETLLLISVIQKLQAELDKERRRPRSFLGYFFDWLSQ